MKFKKSHITSPLRGDRGGSWVVALLLLLIPFITQAQEVADSVAAGPVLEFINKTVDFGEFYAVEPQSGVIRYRNAGDEPLVLMNVTGDCGCTVVKYSHDPLPPDSVGTISVRFNGKGRKPGEFRKMIRIRSNSRKGINHAFVEGTVVKSLVR